MAAQHEGMNDEFTVGVGVTMVSSGDTPAAHRPASHSFVPGAILAGRYRLVALLGRGGMGEVYRADDLTLDQPVALKFLPIESTAGEHLAQFHNELRVARQVSHRNVCRLYDVGEANGRRFITMEYVDGEDLASLIRRIGRLSPDKAIEIARQLCAGLAAAHDRGVVHRDLKPANLMIDGEGNVRITDFGLAVRGGDTNAALAGTPHYMAPEQLAGSPASVKTDIYALGLVLYELFTGKRANTGTTFEELKRWHEGGSRSQLSSIVRDIDPAIEAVVQRCLERDPTQRPASALAVAAALPGANPLAEALAAGQTPSPELIAAVGGTEALRPLIGMTLSLVIVVGLFASAVVADRVLLIARIPFTKSLDVLEDRAKQLLTRIGYTDPAVGEMRTLMLTGEYTSYVMRTDNSPSRWELLKTGAFPSVRFLYRGSPRPMEPTTDAVNPGPEDPPLNVTNMTSVILDSRGALMQLIAVPPQFDPPAPASPKTTDWQPLFDAAMLPMAQFQPVTPQWAPYSYADERAAWEGPLPEAPDVRVHVDVAAYRGRPTFFRRTGPWTIPTRQVVQQPPLSTRVFQAISDVTFLVVIMGAALLARQNFKRGRADRRGATRVAAVMFILGFVRWLVGAQHSLNVQTGFDQFLEKAIAPALVSAALVWLVYLALEPYVRRYTPEILVSWVRLVDGRLRDPRVGRDILVGMVIGLTWHAWSRFLFALPSFLGNAPSPPMFTNAEMLLGPGRAGAIVLGRVSTAFENTMLLTLLFVGFRAVVKRTWLAAILLLAVLTVMLARENDAPLLLNLVYSVVAGSFSVFALWRFGVLASATVWFVNSLLLQAPLTLDMSKIYAAPAMWVLALLTALTAGAYWASRGTEPLFGRFNAD